MAENTEKKVLISVEILNNYVETKKDLDAAKKALNDFIKSGEKNAETQQELAKNLAQANNAYRDAKKDLESASRAQDLLNTAQEKANKTLGEMRRELTALRNTPFDGLTPEQIQEVEQKMVKLNAEISSYNDRIKGMDTTQIWKNTAAGIEFFSASASAFANTLKVFGVESEGALGKLQEKTTELIAIVQAMGVVTEYLSKSKGKLLLMNLANIAAMVKEKAVMIATSATTLIMGKSADATSASFKRMRAAMLATGIGALIIGITALVAVINKLNKANSNVALQQAKLSSEIERTSQAINRISEDADFDEKIAEASGASVKEIRKIRFEAVRAQIALAEMMSDKVYAMGNKATKEQIDEAKKLMDNAYGAEKAYFNQVTIEDIKFRTEQKKRAQNNYLKLIDLEKQKNEASIKAEAGYQSDDFLIKQKYAQRLFDLNQQSEKDKLSTQLKYGKITQAEYKKNMDVLGLQQKEFSNNQIKSLNAYYDEQRKSIIGLLEQSTDEQIKSVTKKYEEARKQIASMPEPTRMKDESDEDFDKRFTDYKRFMLDKAFYEFDLEKQKNAEIAEIEKNAIEKRLGKKYEGDLAKFTDNEREKNRVEIEILEKGAKKRKEIAEKEYNDNKIILDKQLSEGIISQEKYNEEVKKGKSKLNQTIYEDEAKARELNNQAIQLNLNKELLEANNNATAIYEVKKKALEAERELYKDNADKQLEIARALADNERELIESRIAKFEEWSGRTMELLSAVSDLARANEESDLQRYEETNERKKESFKERLDKGLISEKEYNRQVAQADAQLDKQKAEIARKQAIREKLLGAFQIGLNTAAAIMKIWAEVPKMDFGVSTVALTAVAAALGAVQLATVLAAPLPKAKRGALLRGNSHEQGGIPIEAEGGEVIINKHSSRMFLPLLSKINEAGGGIPFLRPYGDGGYVHRTVVNNTNTGITKDEMIEVLKGLKIYTTIEDIRRGDKNYTEIEQNATF